MPSKSIWSQEEAMSYQKVTTVVVSEGSVSIWYHQPAGMYRHWFGSSVLMTL